MNIKEIRLISGLSQQAFSDKYKISQKDNLKTGKAVKEIRLNMLLCC